MDEYGITILNDEGRVQVDSKYMNFTVLQKGSVTIQCDVANAHVNGIFPESAGDYYNYGSGSDWSTYYLGFVDIITPQEVPPLVAIRVPSDGHSYAFKAAIKTPGSSRYDKLVFVAEPDSIEHAFLSNQQGTYLGTLDYIMFKSPYDMTPSTGYGMQVFDENQDLVFDSNDEHLIIENSTAMTGIYSGRAPYYGVYELYRTMVFNGSSWIEGPDNHLAAAFNTNVPLYSALYTDGAFLWRSGYEAAALRNGDFLLDINDNLWYYSDGWHQQMITGTGLGMLQYYMRTEMAINSYIHISVGSSQPTTAATGDIWFKSDPTYFSTTSYYIVSPNVWSQEQDRFGHDPNWWVWYLSFTGLSITSKGVMAVDAENVCARFIQNPQITHGIVSTIFKIGAPFTVTEITTTAEF